MDQVCSSFAANDSLWSGPDKRILTSKPQARHFSAADTLFTKDFVAISIDRRPAVARPNRLGRNPAINASGHVMSNYGMLCVSPYHSRLSYAG